MSKVSLLSNHMSGYLIGGHSIERDTQARTQPQPRPAKLTYSAPSHSGADVTLGRSSPTDPTEARKHWNQSFVANNLHNTHAWYTHPKILITALNGPAVGISAANTAHSDFIYAAPHAYLLTPFTSLGLVAEGGSSRAFVERMGVSKAKEALFLSKRLSAQELLQVGYVNAIIDAGAGAQGTGKGNDSAKFLDAVIAQVRDRFDPSHLSHYSILKMKALVQKPGLGAMDRAGLDEVWGGLDVFLKGAPQREFARMASGEKRHKL